MPQSQEFLITRKLSAAYWPNPGANESANREAGDAAVDKLTLGELVQFFSEIKAGPTYCMVTRRVQDQLKRFPPHIEERRDRVLAALDSAKAAFAALKMVVDGVADDAETVFLTELKYERHSE